MNEERIDCNEEKECVKKNGRSKNIKKNKGKKKETKRKIFREEGKNDKR